MRKNMIMIGAGMMLALASCDKTEIREITEDRVVPQPVDTIKVADHFYLDGHLSRTAEDLGGRPLDAANLLTMAKSCMWRILQASVSMSSMPKRWNSSAA